MQNETNQGGNVLLTLDPAAQQAAYDALQQAVGPDGAGSVVAVEPKTGRVLAMVSLPTYDPNQLADHDFAAADRTYRQLDRDPAQPLVNRAIQTRLFPGSTFKIVTAAAAIENDLHEADGSVPAGATYTPPGTSHGIGNSTSSSCNAEQIPFETAMSLSCNTAFARMAVELGVERMREQAEAFGFNSEYLQDLSPQAESVYPGDDIDDAFVAQTGIGQFEVQSTPLQMAMVSAAIANRGTLMRPYLVEQIQTADYDNLETTEPEELRDAVSPETADQVTDLMVATVEEGTASPAAIQGVTVAGKTGTAQRDDRACEDPDKLPPYAWFTSFAPAEDAEVAVAVMIERSGAVSCNDIAGGRLGGPVAKAVMEAVLDD